MPKPWTVSLGETAEIVAERCGIDRESQDRFALASHRRAVAAWESGAFVDEVVPIEVPARGRAPADVVARDEGPRPETSLEALAQLPSVFRPNGTVTAGNSSPLNDGAAALLLASEAAVRRFGWTPLARLVAGAVAGVEPDTMGLGPVPASRAALRRAGLRVSDLDLVELNEAFAAQALACIRALELDPERINVYGGAIALGHPLGCSGARLMTTLVHEMRRRRARYGLVTLCVGVGQGEATIIERIE